MSVGDVQEFYSFIDSPDAIQAASFTRTVSDCRVSMRAAYEEPKLLPPSNTNRVSSYRWLEELFRLVVFQDNPQAATNVDGQPLFVVAGVCPNSFCGMQAVMYSMVESGVAFWWVKPRSDDERALEPETLRRHDSGPHKNTPGKGGALYQPLADMFNGSADLQLDFRFGLDDSGRAYVEEMNSEGATTRLLLYFVWQETWSSIWARRKYIEGKLCYQRSGDASKRCYARQYRLEDGQLSILDQEMEEELPSLLPPDTFQAMYDVSN